MRADSSVVSVEHGVYDNKTFYEKTCETKVLHIGSHHGIEEHRCVLSGLKSVILHSLPVLST